MKSIPRICVIAAATAASGLAQAGELPNTEGIAGLQFNFSPPGARSLGMGGAFLGRADDATAAYANPAGLTNLFSAEISAEYRNVDFSTEYTSGGTTPNVERSTASSDVNNLSYLSYVHPKENWVFAFYRQQFMDFNTTFTGGEIGLAPTIFTAFSTANTMDMDIVNYGFSLGYRVSDKVSLGASFSYYDFSLNGQTRRFGLNGGSEVNQQVQYGSDDDWGINVGALFRATDRLSIGLVYRTAPEFDASNENRVTGGDTFTRAFKFEVPDIYGIGFSFQPNDNLTLNLDITQVNYSNLAPPAFSVFTTSPDADELSAVSKLALDDGTEIRLGLEYVLSNKPVALRAGVWQDPEHRFAFKGTPDTSNPFDIYNDALFKEGDDETHVSVGFGVFFEHFQVDVAADFSDIQDTISLSGVYRFN